MAYKGQSPQGRNQPISPYRDRPIKKCGSPGSSSSPIRTRSLANTGQTFYVGSGSPASLSSTSRRWRSPSKISGNSSQSFGSSAHFLSTSRRWSPAKTCERFSKGGASPVAFGSGCSRWGPAKFEDKLSKGGGYQGQFGTASRRRSPRKTGQSMGSLGTRMRQTSPRHVTPPPPQPKRESLSFEDAEELDFMDQFLMPTADVEFDEEAQDNAAPWGGYDDVDDNWVAPPEIEPEEPYGIGLPPVGLGECRPEEGEEELDRREGRMFMPTERRIYTDEELGPINWPDTEHIHDINVNFPADDAPFDYLDAGSSYDFPSCETNESSTGRWRDLRHVADQLGFQNFRP